jgi:hypothetical protein
VSSLIGRNGEVLWAREAYLILQAPQDLQGWFASNDLDDSLRTTLVRGTHVTSLDSRLYL